MTPLGNLGFAIPFALTCLKFQNFQTLSTQENLFRIVSSVSVQVLGLIIMWLFEKCYKSLLLWVSVGQGATRLQAVKVKD